MKVLSLESNKTCDCSFSHSFGICTLLYAGAAVLGYTMFGEAILSQFTLNMPKELVATKIAVWTTVYLFYILFQIFLVEAS